MRTVPPSYLSLPSILSTVEHQIREYTRMIRQFNLDDINDILIQPDATLDDNENDETYEEDFENENVSKASSPSFRQESPKNRTNYTYNESVNDTYGNDTFLSEHETVEFTAISSPEASISKANLTPNATAISQGEKLPLQQERQPNTISTVGQGIIGDDIDQEDSKYSEDEYSMDERSFHTHQKRNVISPFQQFDEAHPQEKYAATIKPLQSPPVVPVVNVKNKNNIFKDSKTFSAIKSIDARCVPGVPKYTSLKEKARSDGGLSEAEVRGIVESMLSAQGVERSMNNNGGSCKNGSSGDSAPVSRIGHAPPAYAIEDIMRKAVHIEAPRFKPDVKYNADIPVVKDHHDHRVIVSKKGHEEDYKEEVPETIQPNENTRALKTTTRSSSRDSVQTTNAIAATFDREIKSAAYLMTGKDPVELTLKCDEIYSNFLSDLISACRKQAALSISSEEMAMHRVLAEQMALLYTDRNQIDNIRSKMIWAAREVSLYKTEKNSLNSTKMRNCDNNNQKTRSSNTAVNTKPVVNKITRNDGVRRKTKR